MAKPNATTIPSSEPATALGTGQLDDLLGFHLRMATAALYRDFALAMEGTGLTQKLCAVLELVAANSDVSQIDIANALDTDRATVMALVDRLEVRGFIERQKSARDRRRQILALTEVGKAALLEARQRIAAHEQALAARLPPDGKVQLIGLLKRLYAA